MVYSNNNIRRHQHMPHCHSAAWRGECKRCKQGGGQ